MATTIPVVKPPVGDPAVTTPPLVGTNGDPASGTPAATPPGEVKVYDEEYVKNLRKENADYRTKHKSAEDKLKTFEDKDKSELEKAQGLATTEKTRADAAEARARSMQVQLLANKLGVQPEAADKLIDWSKIDDTDDARTAAITTFLKDNPWVALTPKVAAPNTPGGNPARPGAKLTKDDLKNMTQDQIAKLPWQEVSAAMSSG